jgi:uncharacterized membrane protein YfcA
MNTVNAMRTVRVPASFKWTGITLIALVGLIHLVEAPEYYSEAAYLGMLFIANALGAAVSMWGIYRQMAWGWALGVVVAGGAVIAYFISRTVGLPGFTGAPWFESMDVLSLVVEIAFVVIAVYVLFDRPLARRSHPGRLPTA